MSARAFDDEQEKLLEEACNVVKQQAVFMNNAIYKAQIDDALNSAFNMLCELRTGLLTPAKYYSLYMMVTNELRNLEEFFWTTHRNGKPMIEIYELVQYKANVLPRLYLLITAGNVYIKSKEAPAKKILKDLVEMCKGVQHPVRGLFLRNYLSKSTMERLPDVGSEYEGHGGTIEDAIDFVSQNFYEMNSLWVRMQKLKMIKDKNRREAERKDLRVLVGTNIVRLSELEGVDARMYKETVLPKILSTVEECNDKIAQAYLMDCVVQRFPDDFHLQTLEMYLTSCTKLKDSVDVKELLVALMNRLAIYASESKAVAAMSEDGNSFKLFNDYINKILLARPDMEMTSVLSLQVALLEFSVKCYGARLDYVDQILGFCASVLERVGVDKVDSESVKFVLELLTEPLNILALDTLKLVNYPTLMGYLRFDSRKQVAVRLLKAVLEQNKPLSSPEIVEQLCTFITPLLKDEDDTPAAGDDANTEEFENEQNLVGRMTHLMQSDDPETKFKIFITARKFFSHGGTRRIQYTLVPLIFKSIELAVSIKSREAGGDAAAKKVFQFVHNLVTALASKYPALSLRLFLHSAVAADKCSMQPIAYEFVTQSFIIYEDMTDSKEQLKAISLITGTLLSCSHFNDENYQNLVSRTALFSAKLLKKPDQCRMVYQCARLFWNPAAAEYARTAPPAADDEGHAVSSDKPAGSSMQDGKRVLECLQRSIKIADVCVNAATHVMLFVEILNQYLYYFQFGLKSKYAEAVPVEMKHLRGLRNLIVDHLDVMEANESKVSVEAFFKNTLAHIDHLRSLPELSERLKELDS